MAADMQRPTLTNVHIRSAADAHKLFYAVQLGLLPKIEKRLDANERAALRPGDVYVWEERGPNADSFSVSMERFTEGKSWTASRVREDFLMYFESPRKGKGNARTSENQVVRPGEQDLYIKLTYSVIREDVMEASQSKDAADKLKKPPKWHMNAYFTKLTEGQLRTIDDIPMLRDLAVPEGIFSSARTSKPGKRSDGPRTATSTVKRMYAPFPSHPSRRMRSNDTPPPPGPVPPGPSSAALAFGGAPEAHLPPQPAYISGSVSLLPPPAQQHQHPSSSSAAMAAAALPFFPTPEHAPSSSLSHALSERLMLQDDVKPLLLLPAAAAAAAIAMDEPAPHYGWTTDPGYAASAHHAYHHSHHNHHHPHHSAERLSHSRSPSFSDRSSRSRSPQPLSPALSSASSSQHSDSPMLVAATPPLWDDGARYKPAPLAPVGDELLLGTPRVDLVPLDTLPRTQVYRRSPTDDRALRLLAQAQVPR
ncbi:Gti1/Pac2 family-domain-containing protein [Lenzites betulinus]|nr:Gti1/Pac2 family-domain-containing protein [Lenzites betulinus]